MRIFQSHVTPAPTVRAAMDPISCFQPPLLQVYFAFTRPA
uniref:Uncharacterized protein n=1 Tax=Brassica oleracea TaxID=3712 RepID=A0A3P6C3J2_BRAOL|nr:unnamed protein product [Brassica oleracea]